MTKTPLSSAYDLLVECLKTRELSEFFQINDFCLSEDRKTVTVFATVCLLGNDFSFRALERELVNLTVFDSVQYERDGDAGFITTQITVDVSGPITKLASGSEFQRMTLVGQAVRHAFAYGLIVDDLQTWQDHEDEVLFYIDELGIDSRESFYLALSEYAIPVLPNLEQFDGFPGWDYLWDYTDFSRTTWN